MPYFASHNLLAKILGSLTSDILRLFHVQLDLWTMNCKHVGADQIESKTNERQGSFAESKHRTI